MSSTARRSSFTSAYTDRALLAAVATVARAAAGPDARTVSRARFDAARAGAGHPTLPAAAQIVRRLGVAFSEVLDRALADTDQTMWLASRHAKAPRPAAVTETAHSLRVVAAHLRAETLTPGQYRRVRAELLTVDDARHRHGGRLLLATEAQIRAAAGGDWQQALTDAGLTRGPTSTGRRPTRRAVAVDEALERCLDYHGALPSGQALERFAAAHGFALKRRDAPWAQLVARVRERRAAAGRWTPPAPLPKHRAPDFTTVIAASEALADWKSDPAERRAPKRWDREACLAAVVRFLAEAPAGLELTERNYADWAVAQAEPLPYLSALQRHGSFAELAADARRRYHESP